ncbi:hypothetical protein GGI43DRAFT_433809 [Trichoderma evansii]
MELDSRGYVSIIQLVVYIPLLFVSFIICRKRGFSRSSVWIFILLLCLIWIAGAVCRLAVATLDSIGIPPLLLATLGLLSRLFERIDDEKKVILKSIHFQLIRLALVLTMILSIVGGISSKNINNPSPMTKISICVYCASFLLFIGFAIYAYKSMCCCVLLPKRERETCYVIAVSLPLIFVRVMYSVLAVFRHDSMFSVTQGSAGVYGVMVVMTEAAILLLYTTLGLRLAPVNYIEKA